MTTEIAAAPLNLTVSRPLTPAEARLAEQIVDAVYQSAFVAGFKAGVDRGYAAGAKGTLAEASSLLLDATRALAEAGPAYALLSLPLVKRIERNAKGEIVAITESRS